MFKTLHHHWPEFLMEASGLAIFMISLCFFTTIFEYPGSPIQQLISEPFLRRMLLGIVVGLTAVVIIYSPMGKQSGAHLNPAITLTFFRLGKVHTWDALFYVTFQFFGAVVGVLIMKFIIGRAISHPEVNYAVTLPGMVGPTVAFLAELIISFILMFVVLISTNTMNIARFTGLFAGVLIATYITLESPISGMSMNPARSFGPALNAQLWMALWIYFTAPPIGMLLAAELYLRLPREYRVICAKLHHQNDKRCIFKDCGYRKIQNSKQAQ